MLSTIITGAGIKVGWVGVVGGWVGMGEWGWVGEIKLDFIKNLQILILHLKKTFLRVIMRS